MKKNINEVFRLIKKLIILGIPVYLLAIYAWLFPMNFMPIEYSMWQQEKDYTLAGEKADIVILGDSRAKSGLLPELIENDKISVYNLAIGGATPVEMYYALSHYLKNHDAPDKILMTFAPYHYCFLDNWNQTLANNYLSAGELIEIYRTAAKNNELDAFGNISVSDIISYKLRLPNKYMTSLYNAGFFGRKAENTAKYESVAADKGYTEFGTDKGSDGLSYDTHFDWFDDLKTVDCYLDKLITLCDENDILIIYVQAPVNVTSGDAIYSEFSNGHKRIIRSIFENHPGQEFETKLPVFDNKYFGDPNHLNRDGAVKFTKKVIKKYKDILYAN